MPRLKADPIREDRIHNEVIVGRLWAPGRPEMVVLGKAHLCQTASLLKQGETVEFRRMAPEDSGSNGMLVLVRWWGGIWRFPCLN